MGSCLATYFKPNQQGTRGTRYKRVPTDSTRTTYGTSNRDQASGGATSQRGNDETPSSAAKCEACGLNFNTKTELSVHIASTHGGNIQKQVTRKRKRKKKREEDKRSGQTFTKIFEMAVGHRIQKKPQKALQKFLDGVNLKITLSRKSQKSSCPPVRE